MYSINLSAPEIHIEKKLQCKNCIFSAENAVFALLRVLLCGREPVGTF